jgi:hypothetical protein
MFFQVHFTVIDYVIPNSIYVPWQRYRMKALYKHARTHTHKPLSSCGFLCACEGLYSCFELQMIISLFRRFKGRASKITCKVGSKHNISCWKSVGIWAAVLRNSICTEQHVHIWYMSVCIYIIYTYIHFLRNRSTLVLSVLGYIGILWHKEHPVYSYSFAIRNMLYIYTT